MDQMVTEESMRSDLAKRNVISGTTEQMVKNHRIKATEGCMVNIFNHKQAANESDGQKGNVGWRVTRGLQL